MIYYVATERFSSTVRHFLRAVPAARGLLACLTYEELFFERAGPIGHYVFTDFDRLTRYELECTAVFVASLKMECPAARILNHPLSVLERLPLLVELHKAGVNDFDAVRLDTGERPRRYPVFIRSEDGYGGPETDLLNSPDELEAELARFRQRGLPLKGRIAVGYAAERSPDGFFRKYGAFNIGGRILPHHIQRNRGWVVKKDIVERDWTLQPVRADRLTDSAMAEELVFLRENPHEESLAKAFAIAGIDFGRIDYGIVGGRVQVFEINTNPSMPERIGDGPKSELRQMKRRRMIDAFSAIDVPLQRGRVRFLEPRPKVHDVRIPRWTLPSSLVRRARDVIRVRGTRKFRADGG